MDGIVFVTGVGAGERLKRRVGANRVFVADVSVAAFINPEALAKQIKESSLEASLIVVPGMVQGDVSVITRETGIPCVKGPKSMANIPLFLKYTGKRGFSPVKPAEDVLEDEIRKENRTILKQAGKPGKPILTIGGKLPLNGLSRVVAEIPDAPLLAEKELTSRAKYFADSGASIIDLGMVSGKDHSQKIPDMIDSVRESVNAPVSVDSMAEKEIMAAAEAGADLILSLDEKTISLSESIKVPCVIVPRTHDGKIPETVSERVELLEKLVSQAACPAIADCLTNPLAHGFTWSIATYIKYRGRNPKTPMLMGAGNVTELADADSPGMNMMLAAMASELDIQLLFTTEASPKTRGCVRELSTACEMMYLAGQKNQPPKDLGFDLLKLKDKRLIEPILDPKANKLEAVKVSSKAKTGISRENFRIYVKDGKITAIHYIGQDPKNLFTGDCAKVLYKEIIARRLADGTHAAYLGKELAKAEIALKLGKNYVQDEELF
ncbi:MAG: dihydropteroate synthase-like protein [Candidatus Altiarchaeota archaeon]